MTPLKMGSGPGQHRRHHHRLPADAAVAAGVRRVALAAGGRAALEQHPDRFRSGHCTVAVNHCEIGLPPASSSVLQLRPPSADACTFGPAPTISVPPDTQTESATAVLTTNQLAPPSPVETSVPSTGAPTLPAGSAMPQPWSALTKSTLVSTSPSGSAAGDQVAPRRWSAAVNSRRPPIRAGRPRSPAHGCRLRPGTAASSSPAVAGGDDRTPARRPSVRSGGERDSVELADLRLCSRRAADRRRAAAVGDLQPCRGAHPALSSATASAIANALMTRAGRW